ncbi:MAG: DNA/RNA nuclease SfsA [Lachnospiraceae bacterium]|nr:DNA/RNA nuclease SfsA [Lachnospiraceae bacterium]
MKYKKTKRGEFISRPNRFIAHVKIDGQEEVVHVKNTGRCKELLIPGCTVILEEGDNPARKTKYDLVAVYKEGFGLINMDSQAPNKVVKEWLETKNYDFIKPEYTIGNSRIDFYIEQKDEKILMEIKGCTLEKQGIGYFPDAPTDRGVKHLRELARLSGEGYHCKVGFVIQMEGVEKVLPNEETHPEFKVAFDEAKRSGVEVVFFLCKVEEDGLLIWKELDG